MAQMVGRTSYTDLGSSTIVSAKARVLDAIGNMVCGIRSPAFQVVKNFLAATERIPRSTARWVGATADVFPSRGLMIDATTHGFLAGATAFIDNYGDTSLYSVAHPNTVIMPGAFAAARTDRKTGGEFLASIVVGYQVMEFLGRSLNNGVPRMGHQVKGFRPTATCGPAGVAAAVGKLWGVGEDVLTQSMGVACNLAAGLRRTNAGDVAHMRIHSAEAVRRGIEAVLLVQSGIQIDEEFIEGPGGFFEAMRAGELDTGARIDPVEADRWAINDVAVKLHATPHTLAPGLDCLLSIARADRTAYERVDSVRMFLPAAHAAISLAAAQMDLSTLTPSSALDNLPFCAALVLRTADVIFSDTPARFIGDQALIDLARRVTVAQDAQQTEIFEQEAGSWPARVEVRLAGEVSTVECRRPRGVDLGESVLMDLRRKFDVNCAGLLTEKKRERLAEFVATMERSDDVYGDLQALLGG